MIGIEANVVTYDQNAVFGDGEIEFERRDADLQRGLESGQGVFRRQPSRAAMALQIEGMSERTWQYQQSGECGEAQCHGV